MNTNLASLPQAAPAQAVSSRVLPSFAWLIFILSIALFLGSTMLLALTSRQQWLRLPFYWPVNALNLSLLSYSAVGALIASRRPRNPVGWIFCAMGLTWEIYAFAEAYATYLFLNSPATLNLANPILVLANQCWYLSFTLTLFLLLLFPTGHLLSPRWGPVAWFFAAVIVVGYFVSVSSIRAGRTTLIFASPVELLLGSGPHPALKAISDVVWAVAMLAFVTGGGALVLRLHRARGEESLQLKWFVYACVFFIIVVVGTSAAFEWLRPLDPEALYSADWLYGLPFAIAVMTIPIAAGISILKYHLYDIDVLINRTLVYVPLTAILAGLFAASISLTQKLFVSLTGQTSDAATVLTTLIVVAAFDPIKSRLQKVVDRRFKEAPETARDLKAFNDQARAVLQVMDIRQFRQRALDEAVKAFGATGGAIFLGTGMNQHPSEISGNWRGNMALSIPLTSGGAALGKLSLGARQNGLAYTDADRSVLQQTADLLARAQSLAHNGTGELN